MLSLKKLSHLLHGFTLVELIVVISVLAVLATIAMSQVSNITAGARDSQRMTDMSSMKSSIELYKAKTGKLPMPTNGSGVTYSGGLLWIQGTFGESVVREIKSITPKPIDPISKIEYVYSIANNNREFELGGILEKATGYLPDIFSETLAANQNVTLVKGNYLGLYTKAFTGGLFYIFSTPTLIAGELNSSDILAIKLAEPNGGALPAGFSGIIQQDDSLNSYTPKFAWIRETLPETDEDFLSFVTGLQRVYSGASINYSQIQALLSLTGNTVLKEYGKGILGQTTESYQKSESFLNLSAPTTCPAGFIPVVGNKDFNQPGFCVGKYETKEVGGAINSGAGGHNYGTTHPFVSNATDAPVVNINQDSAIAACASMGSGYHLVTNNEWMTIARDIELNPANWSSGIVGSGYIYSGHNDSSPAQAILASTNDEDGYYGTLNTSSSGANQKRVLTLSNGEKIWDFAGNLGEHVNRGNAIDGSGYNIGKFEILGCENPIGLNEWRDCAQKIWGPKQLMLFSENGVGKMYYGQGKLNNIITRGGYWASGLGAGVYYLDISSLLGHSWAIGFRCAK